MESYPRSITEWGKFCPPGAVAAVSRFRRRDISDFTYLLTLHKTAPMSERVTFDVFLRTVFMPAIFPPCWGKLCEMFVTVALLS